MPVADVDIREYALRGDLSFIAPEVLQEWVVGQRWFACSIQNECQSHEARRLTFRSSRCLCWNRRERPRRR